jgi:hypothetical protein
MVAGTPSKMKVSNVDAYGHALESIHLRALADPTTGVTIP